MTTITCDCCGERIRNAGADWHLAYKQVTGDQVIVNLTVRLEHTVLHPTPHMERKNLDLCLKCAVAHLDAARKHQ